jgi:hypothetical protein
MQYRKRPVIIDAWPVRQIMDLIEYVIMGMPQCIHEALGDGRLIIVKNGILVKTLEGSMMADIDDMLIRGVKGEFYPCKPDIFAMTYEAV